MATYKQKKAFARTLENNGNVSRAMAEVGYSPATAKNPKILTESKGWLELCEEFLPDTMLFEKHKAMLEKKETKTIFSHDLGAFVTEMTDQPHGDVNKALDMAYKLKGKYPDKNISAQQININVDVFKE